MLALAGALLYISPLRAAELAIVIDDVGYSLKYGQRAVDLPAAVTLAVLPYAPHTQTLAHRAELAGHDIIIHQPMEPHPSAHVRTEEETLTMSMSQDQLRNAFRRALDAVPQRTGVSNHTGSLLTAHRQPMVSLMEELNGRGLFFLDSRTTAKTVAERVALEFGVPTIKRDVFLDHDRSPAAIERAFNKAVKIARKRGYAVLVGHPYRESIEFLEQRLWVMDADVKLISAKALAHRLHQQRQTALGPPPDPAPLHISLGQ